MQMYYLWDCALKTTMQRFEDPEYTKDFAVFFLFVFFLVFRHIGTCKQCSPESDCSKTSFDQGLLCLQLNLHLLEATEQTVKPICSNFWMRTAMYL